MNSGREQISEPRRVANDGAQRVIVLVDDNEDDAFLLNRQLRIGNFEGCVEVFHDAMAGRQFLDRNGAFLLIVALSMRENAGFELLNWVRSQPRLNRMLIVAVGLTDCSSEVQRAFDLGANAYYTKGIDFNKFPETLRQLQFV